MKLSRKYLFGGETNNEYVLLKESDSTMSCGELESLHITLSDKFDKYTIQIDGTIKNLIIDSAYFCNVPNVVISGNYDITRIFKRDTHLDINVLQYDEVFDLDSNYIYISALTRFNNIYYDKNTNNTYEISCIGNTPFLKVREMSPDMLAEIDYIKDIVSFII